MKTWKIGVCALIYINIAFFAHPQVPERVEQSERMIGSENDITYEIPDNPINAIQNLESIIRRSQEENILLQRVMEQIELPLTGVEEVIRQEKVRIIVERMNKNIETINKVKKDQRRLSEYDDKQKVIKQQSNLPKLNR